MSDVKWQQQQERPVGTTPTPIPANILPSIEPLSLDAGERAVFQSAPKRCLLDPAQMPQFLQSPAVKHLLSFLLAVNESVKNIGCTSKQTAEGSIVPRPIQNLLEMLKELDRWMDEYPATTATNTSQSLQRFGHPAFRDWQDRLQRELAEGRLIERYLGFGSQTVTSGDDDDYRKRLWTAGAAREIGVYFASAWGNRTRIDYGTGHEMNFMAFLCCLARLRYFDAQMWPGSRNNDYADILSFVGLVIFPRYLDLVRRLQQQYRLEPAGSKSAYGIDDFQIVPYLWGSAQLFDHPRIKPKALLNKELVEQYRKDFMFFGAVAYILQTKSGPFHEHSPMLYDISAITSWHKINAGMIKMYYGELLAKFPVSQHFEFGTLLPF